MSELFVRAEMAETFADRDAFDVVAVLDGQVFRDLDGRRTLRVEIGGATYFLKHHRGVGYWELVKNWLQGRPPVVDASNEFAAAAVLSKLGIATLQVAAYGRRGWNPARRESFLLTDLITHRGDLEELATEFLGPQHVRARWRLIERVGQMVGRMHRAGINHRDLYLCHFLVGYQDDELALIDLHRAQQRTAVPRRWLVKDLGSLWYSALPIGLSRGDYLRFVRAYVRAGAGMSDHRALLRRSLADTAFWSAVERRAQRLAAKGRRKGIPSRIGGG